MGLRERIKPRIQDFAMRFMDELRPETVAVAGGDVLEVGFGTARNLEHYGPGVARVTGVDPMSTEGVAPIDARIARARFPVERAVLRADRELPFDSGRFDCVVTTFTLCSIPEPDAALAEMRRVLKPGGSALVLEFSKVWAPLGPVYDWYSFNVLPRLGQLVAGDSASYRYLAESIRMHPDQAALRTMMETAGFDRVDVHNLAAGVVAVHLGYIY
jgi:ubiquinone/menaquinone biosynthesis methyltransferase